MIFSSATPRHTWIIRTMSSIPKRVSCAQERHHHQHRAVRQPCRDAQILAGLLPQRGRLYVQIDQNGGPIVVTATLRRDPGEAERGNWDKTQLMFGAPKAQLDGVKQAENKRRPPRCRPGRPRRLQCPRRRPPRMDLINNLKDGKVKLEEIKKDELPGELQGKSLVEQKEIPDQDHGKAWRIEQAGDPISTRSANEYIAKEMAEDTKSRARDSSTIRCCRSYNARPRFSVILVRISFCSTRLLPCSSRQFVLLDLLRAHLAIFRL